MCRNSESEIMFMAASSIHSLADALHAETMALYHAVKLDDQLGVGRVLFEIDCLTVQQAVCSDSHAFAPLGQLFQEMKVKLSSLFIQAGVVHVGRNFNRPAHVLAAMGAGYARSESNFWLYGFPVDVTCHVTGNVAVI